FSSGRAQARSVAAEGVKFSNARTSKLSGTSIGGRAKLTSNQATANQAIIGRIKAGRIEFNEISLSNIGATYEPRAGEKPVDSQWTISSGEARARSVIADEVQFTNASASKLSGTVFDGHARITADQATVGRVKAGNSRFNEIMLREISATFE